jgi:hypothetical protein
VDSLSSCGAALGSDYQLEIAPRYTHGHVWEL